MPRRNVKRPLPLPKWSDAEREQGFRRYTDSVGRDVVQCAPGRAFTLVYYPHAGTRVVPMSEFRSFTGAVPVVCVVLSNEPETGLVFASAGTIPSEPGRAPAVAADELDDYSAFATPVAELVPPLVGPVSAEFLASWVGFNAGRGERFLREFIFTGQIPARQEPGRVRIWTFEEAALSEWFPGEDWAAMMREYHATKVRGERGSYKPRRSPTEPPKRTDSRRPTQYKRR